MISGRPMKIILDGIFPNFPYDVEIDIYYEFLLFGPFFETPNHS